MCSSDLMTDSERETLVAFVGANPEAGEIIRESGGVRKVRWALHGMGKRGGARVIYYYHGERLPLFLIRRRPAEDGGVSLRRFAGLNIQAS